ncbi:MAG: CAP domain-containing protein [Synergistaceae bacterium]|nr:CAP domain-containing protein [Synergistaceae bacterium]
MRLKKFSVAIFILFVSATSLYASGIYDSDPGFSPYYAGSVKSSVLSDALSELNYIRWLIGVPNNVVLDSEYTRKAQHGAVLLDAIDTITHTPGRPSDMSESFYELGYDATTHGNIALSKIYSGSESHGNITLSYSTKMYMDDSDSSNISALGHRRWLMNPRMKRTGFGISTRRGYEVTYVIEEFGDDSDVLTQEEYSRYLEWLKWPVSDEYITWPTGKHPHPLTYFDAGTAWSVTLNSNVFDKCNASSVRVSLVRVSDGKTWNFGSSSGSSGYYNIAPNNVAYDECIIFRPDGVSAYNSGETWRAEISGLTRKDGGAGNISFTVTFTDSSTGYEEDRPSPTPNQPTPNQNGRSDSESGGCESGLGFMAVVAVIVLPGIRRRKSAALLAVTALCVIALPVFADDDIYITKPGFSPYRAGTVKREVLYEALAEVNRARRIAGVPDNVTLNDEYTRRAQMGAVLLDATDILTHTPSKPHDMPQDFYELGYDATSHGNIMYSKLRRGSKSWGNVNLRDTTKGYMEDTDGHNVGALGHRRWLLNPRLKQVGFGISTRRGYSVTYVIEDFPLKKRKLSRAEYAQYLNWLKWPIADEFISWPSSKHPHPLDWFEAKTAWSVTLNSNVFGKCEPERVSVRMTRLSDGRVWNFGRAGNDGYFAVCPDNVAYDECLIFCPDDIKSYSNGEYWRVEVDGLTRKNGGAGSFTYTVSFTQ